jgi:hypothetical protein
MPISKVPDCCTDSTLGSSSGNTESVGASILSVNCLDFLIGQEIVFQMPIIVQLRILMMDRQRILNIDDNILVSSDIVQ